MHSFRAAAMTRMPLLIVIMALTPIGISTSSAMDTVTKTALVFCSQ